MAYSSNGALSSPSREEDRQNFTEGRERLPPITTARLYDDEGYQLFNEPRALQPRLEHQTRSQYREHSYAYPQYKQTTTMPPTNNGQVYLGPNDPSQVHYRTATNGPTSGFAGMSKGKGRYQPLVGHDLSGLSQGGKEWLTMALDPFHDTTMRPSGYPDQRTAPTVVYVHREQYTIRAPVSVGSGNWDCHVFTSCVDGMTANNLLRASTIDNRGLHNGTVGGTGDRSLGIVNIHSGNADGTSNANLGLTPDQTTAVPGNRTFYSFYAPTGISDVNLGAQNLNANWRCIGLAYEVANTTAPLYASGSVTSYRTGWGRETSAIQNRVPVAGTSPLTNIDLGSMFQTATGVPENLNVAAALPSSVTWPAIEGAYVVAGMESSDCPFQSLIPSSTALLVQPTSAATAGSYFTLWTTNDYPPPASAGLMGGNSGGLMALQNNFGVSGSYFAGLSAQTVLTVTVKHIYEVIPNPYTATIDLITPSAAYDPAALALYAKIIDQLPPAVPLSWNASGYWYTTVLQAARRHAHLLRPISAAVKMAVPAIAPAITAAEIAIDAYSAVRGRPKRPKTAPAPKRKVKVTVQRSKKA